ncbi:MAG: Rieske 2Fe-2S domain-containing protein [Deltaproteobacteria bacterium]|nr:Rieske 2Fe-2S domain-containing protein [Deltaproteobacteria bacterium]
MSEKGSRGRSLGAAPQEGELIGATIGEKHVALARLQGEVLALDAWCNHAGCLLSEGLLTEDAVMCPCHAVAFRLRDGRVLTEPRICEDQPTLVVEERDGEVFLIEEEIE